MTHLRYGHGVYPRPIINPGGLTIILVCESTCQIMPTNVQLGEYIKGVCVYVCMCAHPYMYPGFLGCF